ncbi:hypothetical protein LCGC14_1069920 [marine sediment metagenome]|uniref:Uncharacterized protein n=1 Tax=marine sediment metagenome TaxID=412755 RepID=A0A0F9QPE1_9ZZZZ
MKRYVKAEEGTTCEWFDHPRRGAVCGQPATICDLDADTEAPRFYCQQHGENLCERCDTSDGSPPLPGEHTTTGEIVCEGCQFG